MNITPIPLPMQKFYRSVTSAQSKNRKKRMYNCSNMNMRLKNSPEETMDVIVSTLDVIISTVSMRDQGKAPGREQVDR
jgi:hypothetical protein